MDRRFPGNLSFILRGIGMMNSEIITVEEQKQTRLLENGLIMADRFINKKICRRVVSSP